MKRLYSTERMTIACLCFAVVGLTASGCGSDPDLRYAVEHPGELHPVAGKVHFNGQPIAGATVIFFDTAIENQSPNPSDDTGAVNPVTIRPRGRTGPDGTFELQSNGVGAPVGEYLVTVSWKGAVPPGSDIDDLPEKLPRKYQDPQSSGLKASVKPGDNVLPAFELK